MSTRVPVHFQKHCPGCFRVKDNHAVCPRCGYDEAAPRSPLFLPHGAVLAGQYRVGKVLGRPGGFGITYLGWDIYLQQKVAIKEYLPTDIAARQPGSQNITPHTPDDRQTFETGKAQFLREARIAARLDHPNIVRLRGFFNANGTAYLVMDYYEGMSLDSYFVQVKPLIEPVVASALMQMVLDGLDYVHHHGVVHRDLKPHNIYLAAMGKAIILDFGAARQASGDNGQSVSVVLTEGYAPLEQYQRQGGSQGPWTDIYGVAATLYRMIVGKSPPVVLDRIHSDPLEAEDFSGIPEMLKPVLRKALAVKREERYQSAAEFKQALSQVMGPLPTQLAANAKPSPLPPQEPSPDAQRPASIEEAVTQPLEVALPVTTMPVEAAPPSMPPPSQPVFRQERRRAPARPPRSLASKVLIVSVALLVMILLLYLLG